MFCWSVGDIECVLDLRPEGLDTARVEDMVKEYFTKADQVCVYSWLLDFLKKCLCCFVANISQCNGSKKVCIMTRAGK